MTATLFKWLGPRRTAHHGGSGSWPKLGEWLEVEGPLESCVNGLHLCKAEHLLDWIAPTLWIAEADDETIECPDKIVARRARLVQRITRWNARTARLFAADCAEHVLPIFESRHPGDDRPRKAIQAARAFAVGRINRDQLVDAWAAAEAAARDAAWDAAWAAAMVAAEAAARAAAEAAARAAAWDAARAAARAAAWDAARDATLAAAWDAAGDAARDVEKKWQLNRLMHLIELEEKE